MSSLLHMPQRHMQMGLDKGSVYEKTKTKTKPADEQSRTLNDSRVVRAPWAWLPIDTELDIPSSSLSLSQRPGSVLDWTFQTLPSSLGGSATHTHAHVHAHTQTQAHTCTQARTRTHTHSHTFPGRYVLFPTSAHSTIQES